MRTSRGQKERRDIYIEREISVRVAVGAGHIGGAREVGRARATESTVPAHGK